MITKLIQARQIRIEFNLSGVFYKQCLICGDVVSINENDDMDDINNWFTPPKKLVTEHAENITHGYCPDCGPKELVKHKLRRINKKIKLIRGE